MAPSLFLFLVPDNLLSVSPVPLKSSDQAGEMEGARRATGISPAWRRLQAIILNKSLLEFDNSKIGAIFHCYKIQNNFGCFPLPPLQFHSC
jgi:hypothetical protein